MKKGSHPEYFRWMKPIIDPDILVDRGAVYKKYGKEEMIFEEGSQGKYYHQLAEGRVKWMNIDETGREFVQKMIREGESFGELPLLDDGPYVASAQTDCPSIVLRLPKADFLQLLRDDPELHFRFTRMMAERLREKFILLRDVSSADPERKVSTILSIWKNEENEDIACPSCSKTKLQLTRKDIASMTGLRVETVIRTMRHLHDKGAVRIERGKVFY